MFCVCPSTSERGCSGCLDDALAQRTINTQDRMLVLVLVHTVTVDAQSTVRHCTLCTPQILHFSEHTTWCFHTQLNSWIEYFAFIVVGVLYRRHFVCTRLEKLRFRILRSRHDAWDGLRRRSSSSSSTPKCCVELSATSRVSFYSAPYILMRPCVSREQFLGPR